MTVEAPDLLANRDVVLAILLFMIGFGAGLAAVRLWKYVLIALVAAILAPMILPLLGINIPGLGAESMLSMVTRALEKFAELLASNKYSAIGFILGVSLALVLTIISMRWRG